MTDLAAIKAELRTGFLRLLTVDGPTKDRRRREFNQAIFNAEEGWAVFNGTDLGMVMEKFDKALALLADTPSVEPPAVSHEATSTTGQANSGGGRDADIAQIAAVLHEHHVGCRTDVARYYMEHHKEDAAALYDAGLRPSVEPAGLEVEPCPYCGVNRPGARGGGCLQCRGRGTVGPAFRANRGLPPLLPTQASDSPEKP